MKKQVLWAISLFVLTALLLYGCCGPTSARSGGSTQGGQASTIFHEGDTFIVGELQYQVLNIREQDSVSYAQARSGSRFVVFDVHVDNVGDESDSVSSLNMKVYDTQNREYDVAGGDQVGRGGTNIQPELSEDYRNFYVEVAESTPRSQLTLKIVDNFFLPSTEASVRLG